MRVTVRPFAREYKSRSFKAILQSPEKILDLDIAARRRGEVQKEAEAVFRQEEFALSPSDSNATSLSSGRVLPCLLTKTSSDLAQDGKPSIAGPGSGASSPKKVTKPRFKQPRRIQLTENSKNTQSAPWSPSMSDEFAPLSDLEILSLIERANAEVVRRKEASKEQLRAEIEEKLKSAGLDLDDLFVSERKITRGSDKSKEKDVQSSVVPKFKNHVSGETWSGRGRSPKWVVSIMQEREWSVEEFKQSDEFLIA
jgi:DNA-binding protein H-NS